MLTECASGDPLLIRVEELCVGSDSPAAGVEMSRRSASAVPGEVSVAYYDLERDFQTGLQRAARGRPALASERRALPAALSAEAAKLLAERRLQALWAGREAAKVRLPWRRAATRPGAVVRFEGREGLWRARGIAFERKGLELELVRLAAVAAEAGPASAGRPIGHVDLPYGPTTLMLLDAPITSERLPARPQLAVLAAGAGEGWRRADLTISYDGGATWSSAGSTAPAAVIGFAEGALGDAGSALIDDRNEIEVALLNDAMWIESRSDAALAAGANLAILGNELIQFGVAEPLGARRFRLSHLLRGRRGTEWAAGGHEAGEAFALIDVATLVLLEAPLPALGGEARVLASGLGDDVSGIEGVRAITGESLRPPSPAHLAAERRPDGSILVRWARRSRNGWSWLDGGDTPLGEEREAYRLTLMTSASRRVVELAEPTFVYGAAEQASDGAAGALAIEVVQLGTSAPSRAASLTIE